MRAETLSFRPISDNEYDNSIYSIAIASYSSNTMPGVMVSCSINHASVTMHNVSADDLRKLAFMFGTMAEDMERVKEEQQNTAKQ